MTTKQESDLLIMSYDYIGPTLDNTKSTLITPIITIFEKHKK